MFRKKGTSWKSPLDLDYLKKELPVLLFQLNRNLRDMSEIGFKGGRMGILLQNPVGHGLKIVEPGTRICKKLIGYILIAPYVLHSGQAVEDISDTCPLLDLDPIHGDTELGKVLGIFNFAHTSFKSLLPSLIKITKEGITVSFPGGKAIQDGQTF